MGTFTFNPQHHVFQLQAKQTRTPSSINLPRKYLSIPIVKMKSASMIAVGAFAFTAVAQFESLPSCGQTCITNMLGLAPSLGCGATDAACLCGNVNFAYGIRDCSNAACGSDVAPSVIAYGVAYCSSAGVAIGGSATATGSDVGSATVITTATSPTGTETSTVTGTGAAGGAGGSSSAITTSAIVSTVTSGSSTFETTVGSSTLSGVGGVIGGVTGSAGSAASSITSGAGSAASSIGSSITSGINSLSSAGASASSSVASAGSSISSAASSAASDATATDATSTSSAEWDQASWRLMQIMDGEICCGERKRYLNLLDLWTWDGNGMRCAHMRIRHAT